MKYYYNEIEKKHKLMLHQIPVSHIEVRTDWQGKMVASVIMEIKDWEQLETDYRGLLMDNHYKCYLENSKCSCVNPDDCENNKSELNAKYSQMNR